ncbi:MAG: pyridoxamine 5'-phosphate oxidase family protein [Pikeienuella sp.]|uniref:pyridoxamine 5'-phosphate oxidase family protein n=1 Tax=Pikeienuella sp. TaxID=2831957 RepID=UPI00391DE234
MARTFYEIGFTPSVLAAQEREGSRAAYAGQLAPEADPRDRLGPEEAAFIAARDGCYQASVSETGWPYVQFRGGPKGFIRALDERTVGYADYRGNRQFLSLGNLTADGRVSLFFMDYPNRARLKLFGRARIVDRVEDPALVARLHAGGKGKPERAVLIDVAGFDWNCPQHIPQRFTAEELQPVLGEMQARIARLEAENAALKGEAAQ